MARLNIEERCFAHSSVRHLAKLMKWDERTAMGCLAFLWHDSQDLERCYASMEDIEVWCRCKDEKEAAKLIESLIRAGYIEPSESGEFYIKGNKEQIASIRTFRERAKKGGAATRKKFEKPRSNDSGELHPEGEGLKPGLEPGSKQASSEAQAPAYAGPNTIQDNSTQDNSTQDNTKRRIWQLRCSSTGEEQAPPVESGDSTSGADEVDGFQAELLPGVADSAPEKPKATQKKEQPAAKLYPPEAHPIARIWNEHSGTLPKVKNLNEARLRHARCRWAEESNEAYWTEVVKKIAKSRFCNGAGDKGWRATFDWLLQPTTHIKAMEGRYDDVHRGTNAPPGGFTNAQRRTMNHRAMLDEIREKGELSDE